MGKNVASRSTESGGRRQNDMEQREIDWVAAARGGDREAMHMLYDTYKQRVHQLAFRYAGNAQDAEDIVQDTFVKVFCALQQDKLQHDAYFATWLFRVTANTCLDHVRAHKRHPVEMLDDRAGNVAAATRAPYEEHERQERHLQVEAAMNALPPRQRLILAMKHHQELKIREIALILHCSEGSVKRQLFRAVAGIRSRLGVLVQGESHEMSTAD
jgi:RNA polymerase sigma-70 factor, ECF subfamily